MDYIEAEVLDRDKEKLVEQLPKLVVSEFVDRMKEDKAERDEIRERFKSVSKTERACSYTLWPYGPEEYKGKRFGVLPESFLRWIASKMDSPSSDRNQLLARRASEELDLRGKVARKMLELPSSRWPDRLIKLDWSREKLSWPGGDEKPSARKSIKTRGASVKKEDPPEEIKPKKHGIEL